MTNEVMTAAARWMVAFLFLASGALKLGDRPGTRGLMVRYKFPVPGIALAVAVAVELGGGLLFGLGLFVPATATILIAYVLAASVMIPVRQLAEPDNRKAAVLTLIKNVAITGALLHFAARPGATAASPDVPTAHLRVARPTDDLDAVVAFYRDGLGFEVLSRFADHDGFDGVMLSHPRACYHLEFTRKRGHAAGRAPTPDNLLVFYLPDRSAWELARERLEARGCRPVRAFNPYWDKSGATYEDPDGYRVVLQNAAWGR